MSMTIQVWKNTSKLFTFCVSKVTQHTLVCITVVKYENVVALKEMGWLLRAVVKGKA